MGYFVYRRSAVGDECIRRGPFLTENEARMVLGNAVKEVYESDAALARHDIQLEVDDAVRTGFKEVKDAIGNLAFVFSIEQE